MLPALLGALLLTGHASAAAGSSSPPWVVGAARRRLSWDLIPDYLEDAAAFAESEYVDLTEISLALVACLFVGVVCVLSFSCLRRRYDCYEPRRAVQPERTLPPLPKNSLFGWICPLMAIQEDDILRTAGLDAVIHIRMYYLAFRIFGLFAIYGFLVILPVNLTGGESSSGNSTLNDFDWFSMSNIQTGSPRMWIHVIGMYLLTFIAMYELRYEWQYFIALRHQYLLGDSTHLRTVLVEKIPEDLRSRAKITAYFQTMYPPDAVAKVMLCQDLTALDSAVAHRDLALAWLERYLRIREINDGREPSHLEVTTCRQVSSVEYYQDLLRHWNEQVAKEQAKARALARRVDRESSLPSSPYLQNLMRVHRRSTASSSASSKAEAGAGSDESDDEEEEGDDHDDDEDYDDPARVGWFRYSLRVLQTWQMAVFTDTTAVERRRLLAAHERGRRTMLPKAFVVFRSYAAATLAQQVVHAVLPGCMVVEAAYEPQDLIWQNLYVSRTARTYRLVVVETLVVLLLIVYVVPVTLIALLVSPDNLAERFSAIDSLMTEHMWFRILIAAIQPCCLFVLMTTLPPLFFAAGMAEGQVAMSAIVKNTFARYYAFQVVNVFLVTTIAGSVLDSLYDILKEPSKTFYLLGQSLPKVGGFFCEYMFLKAFASLPLELSRLVQYMQSLIKKHLLYHLTVREKRGEYLGSRDFMKPYWFNYGKYIAQDQLGVLVAMTYSVIAPLILVPCLCFFAMAMLVYRHQLLYAYETNWQTGGQFWPKIFRRYLFAMFLGQATLIGVMALKSAYSPCYMVGLLMIITAAYTLIMHEVYIPSGNFLPLELASSVDHQNEAAAAAMGSSKDLGGSSSSGGGSKSMAGALPSEGMDQFVQPSLRAPVDAEPEPQPPLGQPYITEAPAKVPPEEAGSWLALC